MQKKAALALAAVFFVVAAYCLGTAYTAGTEMVSIVGMEMHTRFAGLLGGVILLASLAVAIETLGKSRHRRPTGNRTTED